MQSWSRSTNNVFLRQLFSTEGRKHDAGMLADSGLLRDLSQYAFSTTGHPLCLYGDSAYPLRVHPFRIVAPNPLMEEYNQL